MNNSYQICMKKLSSVLAKDENIYVEMGTMIPVLGSFKWKKYVFQKWVGLYV